jgi:hypothetical protein
MSRKKCQTQKKIIMDLLINWVENKIINFKTAFNTALAKEFTGIIDVGSGQITIDADFPWKNLQRKVNRGRFFFMIFICPVRVVRIQS